MGKKSKSSSSLGRALINDRFGKASNARRTKDPTILHSSEVPDGYDWGRLNLRSVTEESSFQEFLSTAQLAETEFEAEKLNIKFINPFLSSLLTTDEKKKIAKTQEENKHVLSIPRRPKWDESTTPEELEANENSEFLEWRRRLAILQEEKGLILTPYEKNLEFWRQLWRVVERSDVVVQIVDARNPLLFHCEDLEKYVHEVSPHKQNLILLNKADFLTSTQRSIWADYFSKYGVKVAFYSATDALEEEDEEDKKEAVEAAAAAEEEKEVVKDQDVGEHVEVDSLGEQLAAVDFEKENSTRTEEVSVSDPSNENVEQPENCTPSSNTNMDRAVGEVSETPGIKLVTSEVEPTDTEAKGNQLVENSAKLLTRSELISLFRTLHTGPKVTEGVSALGLVGYPNVGKSSTINSLLMEKKVSVSATPGKTKHFQTLYLDKDLLLCDCPGLVMPSFVYSKAEMVINGILPIDQMRDHVQPVTLVGSLIPRHVLEDTYGIMIPPPLEGEDPLRSPTSEELLDAYGYNRGFMTQNGQPDNPRSSRYILKDFVNGKLLYCHAPPGSNQSDFHQYPERRKVVGSSLEPMKHNLPLKSSALDKAFFAKSSVGVHTKGVIPKPGSGRPVNQGGGDGKAWKDHSHKRNKREKLRRVYSYLDD